METGTVISIIGVCVFFAFVAYILREQADLPVFIDGLTKLIGLICEAEHNIKGVKAGDIRMANVISTAQNILDTKELKAINKKGGIKTIVQCSFNVLKPVFTALAINKMTKK